MAAHPKRKRGRPSTYSRALADAICKRLAEGESLRAISREEGMPRAPTFVLWVSKDKALAEQYAQARDSANDLMAEEILEIADIGTGDARRDRLRFDARRWYLSKLAPKRYGDRLMTEVSGPNGGPIQTEDLSITEQARRIAFVLAAGARASEQPKE